MEGVIDYHGSSLDHDDDAMLLESVPTEVGILLIVAGIGGIIIPGPIGTPLLVMGGMVLFPNAFRKLDGKMKQRFPETHRKGMIAVRRFMNDMERRYPTHP